METSQRVLIVGGGGIGSAAGLMIRELGEVAADIYIADANGKAAEAAARWISDGSDRQGLVEAVEIPKDGTNDAFGKVLRKADVVLDCLPGSQAPRIAQLAREHGTHYANLTEYVKETEDVMRIADGADKGFVLQTGLAPGFIDVLANQLFRRFCREHGVDRVDSLSMKVGALTRNAIAPTFYGFTWSPVGVATEYVEPAIVVRDSRKTTRPSLGERAPIIVDGVVYEEALTSGGAADLPDALEGRVRTLDYKTLRHPGHYAWIDRVLSEIPEGNGRIAKLQERMEAEIPLVEDDFVVIYAAARGLDANKRSRVVEKSYMIEPIKVGARTLRAIQSTTAAPLVETARMLMTGKYRGVVLQSQIDPDEFMRGPFVSKVYGSK